MSTDYAVRDSLLTVAIGAGIGLSAAALYVLMGWTAATAWSTLVAAGYFAMMMAYRIMDRKRGRPMTSFGYILAGSIATGLATLAVPRIWQLVAGP